MTFARMTLLELSQRLAKRELSSRELVEQALAAIDDPAAEGMRTFIRVNRDTALADADRVDAMRRTGASLHPLAGVPISIKDLFDEAGVTTLGGSRVLVGAPAAMRDSTVVARLRQAGAVIIGRTNLTEFAYSGVGINPHYGTPRNVFDRAAGRVPGGSSVNLFDGCALSVPCHQPGTAPVGLTIAGTQGSDRRILAIGLAVAAVLAQDRG